MDDLFIVLLVIFLIVWLFVLPIVLPIVFAKKYKRIKQAVLELYKKGEITKKQYIYCVQEQPPFGQEYVRPLGAKASEKPSEISEHQFKPEPAETSESETKPEAQVAKAAESAAKSEVQASEVAETEAKSDAQVSEAAESEAKSEVQEPEADETEAKSEAKVSETAENEVKSEVAETSESGAKSEAKVSETAENEVKSEAAETSESGAKQKTETIKADESETKQEAKAVDASESKAKSKDKAVEKPEAAAEPEKLAARNALENKEPVGNPLIPIPVILGLGVVLICTAGAAYISSFWGTASEIVKLIAVGSFSLIFYGAFRLAHNKLQIVNSAKAFYILCIAALGITVTAAELFGLILDDVSPAAKMLLPCAVIAAGMFRGYYIFKSRLFPILGILFVFLFLTALSTAIFDAHAMMFFIPAVAATGGLAYTTLSKKESAENLRKPAFVLFLVFISLLMLSSFALDNMLHKNLMTAFALSLAILMHIQLHQKYNRFVECAIPVALCWAALSFNQSISHDSRLIALFVCCTLQCAAMIAAFISMRRYDKSPHPIAITLYALAIGVTAIVMNVYSSVGAQGYALFIPALTFILLGAHLMKDTRALPSPAQESSKTEEASESEITSKPDGASKPAPLKVLKTLPFISACIALFAGGIYTLGGYTPLESDLRLDFIWILNLIVSAVLLALALVPERFRVGDLRSRRYTSFILMVLLSLWHINAFRHSSESILNCHEFHQMLFLVPAFALTLIERRDALRTGRRTFAIAAHISAVTLVLWLVALVMLLLDDMLREYLILDLSDFINAVDTLLLAGIVLYESKKPLCPKLGYIRLGAGAALIGLSYFVLIKALDSYSVLIKALDDNLTGDSAQILMIPWIATAIYLAIILFYTFRKKIAYADAPHLRLRGTIALLATMSFMQCALNARIAAVLLIPALALTFLDERRSAKLKSPKDQTIAAIIGSVIFCGLIALLIIKMRAIFNVDYSTKETIQDIALAATALLFSLAVLAEHLFMHKREIRPYRLVAAVDLELTAACTLLLYLCDGDFEPPIAPEKIAVGLMILAAGLIGSWCMSHREHRKYGPVAALAVFFGLYAVLYLGWSYIDSGWLYDSGWLHKDMWGEPYYSVLPYYFVWIATAVITAAIAFFDGFKRTGYTHLRAVWALAFVPLIFIHYDPYHIAHLAGVLIVALNLLQYLRDRGQSDHDRTLITISSGIIAIALSLKIMVLPEDSWLPVMIRPELIALIPLAAAYLVSWRVWKFREPSHLVSSISALVILPLLYLVPEENVQFHAITVTALAIASIIVAFRIRLNRYLTIGIVSIVIIFFSQTKNFWFSLHWWVYLAVVGVILLTIAVINETERRKGSTLVRRAKDMAARAWKW